MLQGAARSYISNLRQYCTATRRRILDEGDWIYSSEWWGTQSDGHTVVRANSDHGNGVVSVVAYPCSRPVGSSLFCLFVLCIYLVKSSNFTFNLQNLITQFMITRLVILFIFECELILEQRVVARNGEMVKAEVYRDTSSSGRH